eukprot:TRINITY_DN29555_c0_g1_i1.p1 TRINITY_DN29555_c0_g1~~TRINITY_DN29555_c0_g1_i1.p1  ORF type:complete len:879 (+),score=228.04 TRINITY_DN29555_c0_g1_i1:193-2829(+)
MRALVPNPAGRRGPLTPAAVAAAEKGAECLAKYQRLRMVGKGSFGQVHLIRERATGNHYVMKVISLVGMQRDERRDTLKEATMLERLDHPNIIRYVESFEASACLHIITEFASRGDLHTLIEKRQGKRFREDEALDLFVQICLALKYLHELHILHRDIKTSNIFLTSQNVIKLGDFGIAKVLTHTMQCARTAVGTPYYMSPELCQERPYNNRSDVWALGCVLYELATLRHAFEANSIKALVAEILRGRYRPLPPEYSKQLRELVQSMLMRDPLRRPSVAAVLQLPFIRARIAAFIDGHATTSAPDQAQPGSEPQPQPPPPSAPPPASPPLPPQPAPQRRQLPPPRRVPPQREATPPPPPRQVTPPPRQPPPLPAPQQWRQIPPAQPQQQAIGMPRAAPAPVVHHEAGVHARHRVSRWLAEQRGDAPQREVLQVPPSNAVARAQARVREMGLRRKEDAERIRREQAEQMRARAEAEAARRLRDAEQRAARRAAPRRRRRRQSPTPKPGHARTPPSEPSEQGWGLGGAAGRGMRVLDRNMQQLEAVEREQSLRERRLAARAAMQAGQGAAAALCGYNTPPPSSYGDGSSEPRYGWQQRPKVAARLPPIQRTPSSSEVGYAEAAPKQQPQPLPQPLTLAELRRLRGLKRPSVPAPSEVPSVRAPPPPPRVHPRHLGNAGGVMHEHVDGARQVLAHWDRDGQIVSSVVDWRSSPPSEPPQRTPTHPASAAAVEPGPAKEALVTSMRQALQRPTAAELRDQEMMIEDAPLRHHTPAVSSPLRGPGGGRAAEFLQVGSAVDGSGLASRVELLRFHLEEQLGLAKLVEVHRLLRDDVTRSGDEAVRRARAAIGAERADAYVPLIVQLIHCEEALDEAMNTPHRDR